MNDFGLKIIGAIEIGKLELHQGDVLVVKIDRPVSNEVIDKIRKNLKTLLPEGVTIMIIDRGVSLSILTKTEIEERVA